jgi:hypothetical protein
MSHYCDFRFRPQESVAASTRVLGETVSGGHQRYVMPEYSAEVPHFLVEDGSFGVGITVSREEEGVAALNADVLVMAVALDKALICVMAKETRERMTNAR